jgi:multiple sugar transport system substrate-binding protein
MAGAGRLGITAASANFLLNAAGTRALTADFDWKKYSGKKIHLLLNKHPYADAMIADLPNFKTLTGMEVTYDIFPEDVYFDKVTAALSSKSSQYDAFMTGAI